MIDCIYCQQPLAQLKDPNINYYFCVPCFQKHSVAVLYSYDSWGDRFTSVYLDYYHNDEHIRVGIQPFLKCVHVVLNRPNKIDKVVRYEDMLIINIEAGLLYVMLHPHYPLRNIDLTLRNNMLLTPQNVMEKISLYLLFS